MAMTMIAKIVLKWDIDFVDAARKNVLADTSEGAWKNALSPARETPSIFYCSENKICS